MPMLLFLQPWVSDVLSIAVPPRNSKKGVNLRAAALGSSIHSELPQYENLPAYILSQGRCMEPIVINNWVLHQAPISVINTSL